MDDALAGLEPPRRHYTHYFGLRHTNSEMVLAPQGLAAFLRGYFHLKSGDAPGAEPEPLGLSSPEALARLPDYYVMPRDQTMAQVAAAGMPSRAEAKSCAWLPKADLDVFTAEFGRTGFQGGLNWYRAFADPALRLFSGRTLDVPSAFIAGRRDWGVYQSPGAFEAMAGQACTRFVSCDLIPGAGHWVQQEAPVAVAKSILAFVSGLWPKPSRPIEGGRPDHRAAHPGCG